MIFPEQKKNALDGLVDQPEIPHRLNLLFHTLCVQAAKALVILHEDLHVCISPMRGTTTVHVSKKKKNKKK